MGRHGIASWGSIRQVYQPAGERHLHRSPRVSKNSVLPASVHRADCLDTSRKPEARTAVALAAALGAGPSASSFLVPSSRSPKNDPLPTYLLAVLSLGRTALRSSAAGAPTPSHPHGQPCLGPPRSWYMGSPVCGCSTAWDPLQAGAECGSFGQERDALAQLLTNLHFLRAPPPPSGTCPPNLATPLHTGPRPVSEHRVRPPNRFGETKELWSNFPYGGQKRLPGPCTPTPSCSPALATNPGQGRGARVLAARAREEGSGKTRK